jgi:hypothetical protein
MDVTAVPAETVISGQVDDDGVQQVLALIQSLGLKVVSLHRANGARKAREHIVRSRTEMHTHASTHRSTRDSAEPQRRATLPVEPMPRRDR